jgi:hypothetical protein
LNILKSAFEKLSADNLTSIKKATEISAKAVSPGGSLFGVATEMLASLKRIEKGLVTQSKSNDSNSGKVGSAILMSIIGGKALTSIGKGLSVIVDAINKLEGDSKEITERMKALTLGIDSIASIGPSILKFAGYLFLATPLLMIGAIAAPLFGLSLFIITKTLAWAAKPLTSKPVQEALASMKDVGIGILVLGGALALSLPIYTAGIVALPLVALTLLTIGGVFYLLDKMGVDKSMKDVATAYMFVGLSIVTLGLSILAFDYFMSSVEDPLSTLLIIGGVIVGLGLAFFIAGKMASSILKGALVMTLAAIPLILIGVGVKMFADSISSVKSPWEFMAQIGVFIVGLGTAMSLAGVAAPLIIPGAAAMVVAGIALMSIAKGASMMGEVFKSGGLTEMLKDSGEVTESILGFGGGRKMSNLEYFMLTVARSFTLYPNQIASMYASAPALIMSGLALSSIAKGISGFQKLSIDYNTLPKNIASLLTAVSKPFAEIGETYKGGFLFGSTPAELGVKAVSGMGNALTDIAGGVQSMANLKFPVYGTGKNSTKIIGYKQLGDGDFVKASQNFAKIIDALRHPFARIGETYKGGFLFGSTPVELGVKAVGGMGKAITGIAGGVQSMANLKFPVYGTGKNSTKIVGHRQLVEADFTNVAINIGLMVKSLTSVFADIGKNPDAESSWWGGNSNIENGIEMVTQMSAPLNAIANITKTFANLKVNTNTVAVKIKDMVKSLSGIFTGEKEMKIDIFKVNLFGTLGDNLNKIADASSGFEKFKKSYGKFVDHHIRFKDSVNGFDKENLKLTSEMFQGLASLSKTNNAISQMGDQLESAISKLAQMIEEAKKSITGGSDALTSSTNDLGNKISAMPSTINRKRGGTTSDIDIQPIVEAIQELEERFSRPIRVQEI